MCQVEAANKQNGRIKKIYNSQDKFLVKLRQKSLSYFV